MLRGYVTKGWRKELSDWDYRGKYLKQRRNIAIRRCRWVLLHRKNYVDNWIAKLESPSYKLHPLDTVDCQDILRDLMKKNVITRSQKHALLSQLASSDKENKYLALLLIKTFIE